MPEYRRFDRSGMLAIEPAAFMDFFLIQDAPPNVETPTCTIVSINGPLEQHAGWCDSYDAVRARVKAAFDAPAPIVVLRVDSPGGDVAGCFDTARYLRACADATGKPLIVHVEGRACSAAYALASVADHIAVSDTGMVGSIGVISIRTDLSQQNTASGVRIALVTSGARKADGNPDAPITDAELAETQATVDSMAQTFFELVAEFRPTTVDRVKSLQARVVHGTMATTARLADTVESFDNLLLRLASGDSMPSPYEKAKKALQEAAEGDDANAAAAKRALAAMDEGSDPDAADDKEPDGDEPPAPDKKDAKRADDSSDDADAKRADDSADDTDAKKALSPEAIALKALAEVHTLRAEMAKRDVSAERDTLLASRPDFAPEMRAALAKAPIAVVRDMVKTLPKAPSAKPAATAVLQGARGVSQGQGGQFADVHPADAHPTGARLDAIMGVSAPKMGVRREGTSLVFGVPVGDATEGDDK
jgi:ClpP class serine protease